MKFATMPNCRGGWLSGSLLWEVMRSIRSIFRKPTEPRIRTFCNLADAEGRIVVTKDSDFVDSHILAGSPKKLLLISTDNISNLVLETLFVAVLPDIIREFASNSFLELSRTGLSIRG